MLAINSSQAVGERLAISGLNVAYALSDYPTNGPFFTDIAVTTLPDGNFTINIEYDQTFLL